MKITFLKTSSILSVAVLSAVIMIFSACDKVQNTGTSHNESSYCEQQTNTKSESKVNSVSKTDSSKPEPEYSDTFFKTDTFIKYCNASEEPNYESIYKFDTKGTMTCSFNMYEGFEQSEGKYFVRKYKTGIYQIMNYTDSIDTAKILFTVYKSNEISADAPANFINEKEFNSIYDFHDQWNKQAMEQSFE